MLALSEIHAEVEISEHDGLQARQGCRPEALPARDNLIDAGEGSSWLTDSEQLVGALEDRAGSSMCQHTCTMPANMVCQ